MDSRQADTMLSRLTFASLDRRRWVLPFAAMIQRTFAAVVALLLAAPAWAQDQGKGQDGARYQKTTQIDFEDDTIEGDLSKPDGEYVEARKRVGHEKLIRIREDFKDKVMESVSEL